MEEMLRAHLIDLGSRLEASKGLSLATIGKRALNDNTVFARLAAGDMGFNIRTYDRLVAWFSRHWPSDVEWPSDIERPASSKAA